MRFFIDWVKTIVCFLKGVEFDIGNSTYFNTINGVKINTVKTHSAGPVVVFPLDGNGSKNAEIYIWESVLKYNKPMFDFMINHEIGHIKDKSLVITNDTIDRTLDENLGLESRADKYALERIDNKLGLLSIFFQFYPLHYIIHIVLTGYLKLVCKIQRISYSDIFGITMKSEFGRINDSTKFIFNKVFS